MQSTEKEKSMTCNLSKGVAEEAVTEASLYYIRNLEANLHISTDEAMSLLDIPGTRQEYYRELLKEMDEQNKTTGL